MAEYIDREAVLTKIHQYTRHHWPTVSYVESIIKEQPAADVAPVVHGRWIEYPVAHYYKCSECRYTVPYRKAALMSGKRQYNYCPSCGAKMVSEE